MVASRSDVFSLRSGGSYARIPSDDPKPGGNTGHAAVAPASVAESRPRPAESIGLLDSQRQDVRRCMTSVASNWEPAPKMGWDMFDQDFLESGPMQAATICLILLNAVVIGLETDFPEKFHWDIVENIFLVCFTIELVIRMYCLGARKFFLFHNNPDIAWNIFDFLLVAMGVLSLLLHFFAGSTDILARNATLFRIIRLLRILRVLRIIRIVRFLKQLYLLAYGFIEGTMAVLWVTILASFMLYICAVILVRAYGKNGNVNDPYHEFFEEHFGTIPTTMFALFELITAPDLAPYREAMFANPPLVVFLVIFIILGSFGINGLLVALINESILEKNQARIEADRMDRESKRKTMQQRCGELFDELDVNRNRVLPRDEIRQVTEQIAILLESFGVNFQRADLDQMFYVMDYSDTGIIERSEFIQGVVGLCDQIRPMSIMELHYQVSKCVTKMEGNESKIENLVKGIDGYDEKLDAIHSRLKSLQNFVHLGAAKADAPRPAKESVSFADFAPEVPPTSLSADLGRETPILHTEDVDEDGSTGRQHIEAEIGHLKLPDADTKEQWSTAATPNESPSNGEVNVSVDASKAEGEVSMVLRRHHDLLQEAMKVYAVHADSDVPEESRQKLVETTLKLQEANVGVLGVLLSRRP